MKKPPPADLPYPATGTLDENVAIYNGWAEATGKRYRLRLTGDLAVLAFVDALTGEVVVENTTRPSLSSTP